MLELKIKRVTEPKFIALNLRECLAALNISTTEFCRSLGVSSTYGYEIIKGTKYLTETRLHFVKDFLIEAGKGKAKQRFKCNT